MWKRIEAYRGQILSLWEKVARLTEAAESFRRRSQDLSDPVVRVGHATALDVDQLLAEPHGDGAGRAAADEKIAARGTHPADRRDDGRRAAGEGLLQPSTGGISAPAFDPLGWFSRSRSG